MHDTAFALFVLALPVAVAWGLVVGLVAVGWLVAGRGALRVLRTRHAALWEAAGRPWLSYMGPGASRPQGPSSDVTSALPYPSFGWLLRFSLSRFPIELASDAELLQLHRRTRVLGWIVVVAGTPLVAYFGLALSSLFRGG